MFHNSVYWQIHFWLIRWCKLILFDQVRSYEVRSYEILIGNSMNLIKTYLMVMNGYNTIVIYVLIV